MKNVIDIDDHKAVVSFDPDTNMFRGEFINLSGGADFYASDVEKLYHEGRVSLRVYLNACRKKGIEPYRGFSGKFNLRLSPELHERAVLKSEAEGMSLNEWIVNTLKDAVAE